MKEKWEKKAEEWKNNSENGDEAQAEGEDKEKKCKHCSFLPTALSSCIRGNIVRVSFRLNFSKLPFWQKHFISNFRTAQNQHGKHVSLDCIFAKAIIASEHFFV